MEAWAVWVLLIFVVIFAIGAVQQARTDAEFQGWRRGKQEQWEADHPAGAPGEKDG